MNESLGEHWRLNERPTLLIRAVSHAKETFSIYVSNGAEQLVASGNPRQLDGNAESECKLMPAFSASAHRERTNLSILNNDSDALVSPFPHFEYRLSPTKKMS